MKVLVDGLQMGNQSGTGSYSEELLSALVDGYGAEHEFLTTCSERVAEAVRNRTGARVLAYDLSGRGAGTLFRNGSGRRSLAGVIRAEQPDIVHYPANIGRVRRLPGGVSSKTVLTVHDLTFFREPAWFERSRAFYYRWGARRSVRYADRIIADSICTREDIEAYLGISETRIDVTLLGVSEVFRPQTPESVAEYRTAAGLPESFFLYAGTLEPRKNIPRIVQAWDASFEEHGLDLVIAGRDGWKTGGITRAIQTASHRDRIHRIGFVASADQPLLYSAATAFVWPSLWEGFGLPPLEAMACGTPVITSSTSSLPEVVDTAALLADPLDVHALSGLMIRIAKDSKLRAALRNKGLNRARELSWRRTADLTMAAYQRALGDPSQ